MTWQRFATTPEGCLSGRFYTPPSESERAANPDNPDSPSPAASADPAPPWRTFLSKTAFEPLRPKAWERWLKLRDQADRSSRYERARNRAASFVLPDSTASRNLVLAVNAALSLRRPLLLSGRPGSGKTTLAYVVAQWLGLGPVLEWSVSPGATLADALVSYDPLARLQDLEIARKLAETSQPQPAHDAPDLTPKPVEHYMRLGPVGTAFLPMPLPRVLLIDEIDKGDLNLANELLHLFEEGKFTLPQLQRGSGTTGAGTGPEGQPRVITRVINSADEDDNGQPIPVEIQGAVVQCYEFPLVVMTSNGEREFPAAFNRRCLRVRMPDFSDDSASLEAIVRRHWQATDTPAGTPAGQGQARPLAQLDLALQDFQKAIQAAQVVGDHLALDQLLNLAYLLEQETPPVTEATRRDLRQVLLQALEADPEQQPPPGSEPS
jgi:MoxR-like ATPase